MESNSVLLMGADAFTLREIVTKAAAFKGLKIQGGASWACSETIKEYPLDNKTLAALAKRGIEQQPRPDCSDRIFTLVDNNPQTKIPGYAPSNYWNFLSIEGDKPKFDLSVSLFVDFNINIKKRGIVFWPRACGKGVSAGAHLPNYRMFKALTENDSGAPLIAQEIAGSDGTIVVTWTDLGLGGLRRIADLFVEFASDNGKIIELGEDNKVFDPAPYPRHQQSGDELFIAETIQPKLIEEWAQQLDRYRNSLVAA